MSELSGSSRGDRGNERGRRRLPGPLDVLVASATAYGLAEGPLWDPARERVLWVDINAGAVHASALHDGTLTGEERLGQLDETVGAAVVSADGELLVAAARSIQAPGSSPIMLVDARRASRLNDGACDPAGRFLVGSMSLDGRTGEECLYRIEHDGSVTVIDDDLTLSNGIGWSPDATTMYSVDTTPGVVWARGYDAADGSWGKRRAALQIKDGSPDGLCVDSDGGLWIAIHGAGQVRRYTPDGERTATIEVPAPHTTSVAFVGRPLDTLLITTAFDELGAGQRTRFPLSGHLFTTHVPGVTGRPTTPWAGPAV